MVPLTATTVYEQPKNGQGLNRTVHQMCLVNKTPVEMPHGRPGWTQSTTLPYLTVMLTAVRADTNDLELTAADIYEATTQLRQFLQGRSR